MKNLREEISSYEITDELIAINKRYQKLGDLHDKYEELIDTIKGGDILNHYNSDDTERKKTVRTLEKLQNSVSKEMRKISDSVHNDIFLFRMMKGAMMLKSLKEVA